jgi:Glycosyl transferase family 2/Methyltransferase domain
LRRSDIQEYFERVAPSWEHWQRKNEFYHAAMRDLIGGMIPPGSRVLEVGSGVGDLLASLKPRRGIGLNLGEGLTQRAREKYPEFEFHTIEVDSTSLPPTFEPDYAVMTNMLDYVYDVWDMLEGLKPAIHEGTLLIVTTNNPLWAPILRLASKLGLRIPDSPRNFITNRDICSVLSLQGFQIVEEGLTLPVPKRIPLLGPLVNAIVPELPVLRFVSSIQYIAARLRFPRPRLSCSVVIPCHNEAENIAECVRRVPAMGVWTEIIVVDDGSTDGTRSKVKAILEMDPRVRLVVLQKNQGKAAAVRAGFAAALGDVLMILDADMAVAPEELPKFLIPLQEGTTDFVNGTRLIYPMHGKAMKVANFLGNKGFCLLASKVLRQRVSDTLCGTKAFFRRDYDRMPIGGKERWGDFDFLFGAARLKLRILELPVHYTERRAGKSKMRVLVDGWHFLRACFFGWRMLRFPQKYPWGRQEPAATGAHELRADAEIHSVP